MRRIHVFYYAIWNYSHNPEILIDAFAPRRYIPYMLVYVADPDKEQIARTVHYINLEGFQAKGFSHLPELENAFSEAVPSVLVLDLSFPEGNGFPLLRNVRLRYPCSIIVTSMSRSESDIILSYELGCDDYIAKPFRAKEVLLRIQAVFRRNEGSGRYDMQSPIMNFEQLGNRMKISMRKHIVSINGNNVSLTEAEWKILYILASNANILISRQQLLQQCFEYKPGCYERLIDTHIKNLRRKLQPGTWIDTIRSFGYRFTARQIIPPEQ